MKNQRKGHPVPHIAPKPAPDREEVARHAYQLWQHEGQPADRHEAHWFEAEKQLGAGDSAPDAPESDRS